MSETAILAADARVLIQELLDQSVLGSHGHDLVDKVDLREGQDAVRRDLKALTVSTSRCRVQGWIYYKLIVLEDDHIACMPKQGVENLVKHI